MNKAREQQVTKVSEHLGNWATWTFLWDQAVQRQAGRILGAEFEDAQVDIMLVATPCEMSCAAPNRSLGKEHPAVKTFNAVVPDLVHIRNIFLEYGNTWRKTLRESYRVEGLDVCEWEWCEPLISVLDPRSYTEVRAGADVLWRGAWFEAALPDWM